MFLTSLLYSFYHCPCPCSHAKSLINDSNIPTHYVGYTGHHWETVTWYNWHNITLRIWTLCRRDLYQQVAVIQFMQDIPFPFRFYKAQWCRWEVWWARGNQSTASQPDTLTYLLTPWSRVLLEKLTGSAASQEIPRIFGTRRFPTVLPSACHLSLSWANFNQSPQPPPTSWRSILILSSHLRLDLPNGLFPSGFPTRTLCHLDTIQSIFLHPPLTFS